MAQTLPDPALSLEAFQQAIMTGEIILDSGLVDPDLYVLRDHPAKGRPRFTFARIREDATVTAFAVAVLAEPVNGLPCFQIGYAVPKRFRKQGRAKAIVGAALAELRHDLEDAVPVYFIAAVVGVDNPISQAVATAMMDFARSSISAYWSGVATGICAPGIDRPRRIAAGRRSLY